MKNLLLCSFILLFFTNINAQTSSRHDVRATLRSEHKKVQSDMQRPLAKPLSIIFKAIAQRDENYDSPSSTWMVQDSSNYSYDVNANDTAYFLYFYTSGVWNNDFWNSQTYDGSGHLLTLVQRNWDYYHNTWLNTQQTLNTYDSTGDNTVSLYQTWDTLTSVWVNNGRNNYMYDANHHLTDFVGQGWNTATGNWVNGDHHSYTNDANGNQTSSIWQFWVSGVWQNYQKVIYTFDVNNHNTEEVYQFWDTVAGNWYNTDKYDQTFDGSGNVLSIIRQGWNNYTSVWYPVSRETATYSANNINFDLTEYWDTATKAYENSSRIDYTYDGNGNLSVEAYSFWKNLFHTPNYRFAYSYDADNNRTIKLEENYNTSTQNYEPASRTYYFYQSFNVSSVSESKNELGASIFPNPSSANEVTLKLNLNENSIVAITIYDAQGRIVSASTQPASGTVSINTGSLAAGNYVVQIVDRHNGKTSLLKMTKE